MSTPKNAPKYTPGPWTSGSARTGRVFGADGYEVCDPTQGPHLHVDYDSDRGHWATTPGAYVDRTDEEIEANANLIAAAPDLLAACRRILVEDDGCSCSEGGYCAWCLARAAIAKAEGGE